LTEVVGELVTVEVAPFTPSSEAGGTTVIKSKVDASCDERMIRYRRRLDVDVCDRTVRSSDDDVEYVSFTCVDDVTCCISP